MIFKDKNILLISPEPWSNTFVSKHHYAVELAKHGNKVFFLNPPGSHLTKRFILNPDSNFKNIIVVDYKAIRGLRYLPVAVATLIEKVFINLLQKACNVKFDIIWNFENSRFYNFNVWPKKVLKVLHLVDYNQDFHIKKAAITADICFCTSDFIKDRLSRFNTNTFKIHHGTSCFVAEKEYYRLPGKNKLKAGYIGNLSIRYIDYNTILTIAEANPEVDFYLVGPLDEDSIDSENRTVLQKMKQLQNVYFLGIISSVQIPALLKTLDILLVVYKAEDYKEQLASPHKIMEYLQSGKVILASYTDEYKDKPELLVMAQKKEELTGLFNDIKSNLEFYNSQENQNKRKQFAEANTYLKQLKKIENIILENVR